MVGFDALSSSESIAPLGPDFFVEARDRLRDRARRAKVDGLLLLTPGNVRYATGWHFSVNERPVGLWLPTSGEARLLVPRLELELAAEVSGVGARAYDEFPGLRPPVIWMLEQCGARSIAVDRLDAALLEEARLKVPRLELVDHARPVRAVKTTDELALIREASRFADAVLDRLRSVGGDLIGQGANEADLLRDCTTHVDAELRARHGVAFAGTKIGITASLHSGPRAALPHGDVTDRIPQPGEPVIAGIGCHIGGYHAESGATFVVGEPDADQLQIMDAMSDAGAATVDALARRATCTEVNDAALGVLRAAGLGDTVRHRIGHGMGVEGHEAPWLAPGDPTPVEAGMVFSCEPGVYRPGREGWRTIDTLLVLPEEVEVASSFLRRHPARARTLDI